MVHLKKENTKARRKRQEYEKGRGHINITEKLLKPSSLSRIVWIPYLRQNRFGYCSY